MTIKKLGYERLESRLALTFSILESDDIGYFFDSESNIVQRYDIQAEAWIHAIALENTLAGPQVAHVDADGIYASFGQTVYRYALDGSSKTHLINSQSSVISIHSDGDLLMIDYSSSNQTRFVSISKSSNYAVDSMVKSNYYYNTPPIFAIASGSNTFYGASSSFSTLQLSTFTYDQSGKFSQSYSTISNYGDYPAGVRSWVFPDESKLIHSSGTIFATSDLRSVNRIAPVDDIDYLQSEIPFVVQGNQITAYSKAFLPTGMVDLGRKPIKIFVGSTDVVAFFLDSLAPRGYQVQIISLSDFHPADPNLPIDPTGLAYTPDWTGVSNQARVLLLSKSHQNIFIWNPMTSTYERSIGLLGSPNAVAYDRAEDLIYVAYESGLIYTIDLQDPQPHEVPFYRLPGKALAIATAGEFVFAVNPSSYRYEHRLISRDGYLLSLKDHYEQYTEFVWDSVNQAIYASRGNSYSTGLMWESIDAMGNLLSPPHSYYFEGTGAFRPVRFNDGSKSILLGSGLVFDAKTLKPTLYTLANSITDAVWFAGRWVTIRNIVGVPQLQQWLGQTFEPIDVLQWPSGTGYSVQALTSNRIVITVITSQGVPSFLILDENLQPAKVNNTWHNYDAPMDVDDDEFVSPLDILIMIDQINLYGSRQIINVGEHYCDADNDGVITPLDILDVIDWINLQKSSESKPNGESEFNTDFLFAVFDDWPMAPNKRLKKPL
ncbi:MAG: dockerin type I domain-containing protein [Planctomycetota bacterium]